MNDSPVAVNWALEAKDLSVDLGGQRVLEIPSLRVKRNEVLTIVGPNGSGKTTLLLCLASLLRPTTGTVSYEGRLATSTVELRRRFAVVFQEPLLLHASVWDNVTLGLRLRGKKPGDLQSRTQKWLDRFGVGHLPRRNARTLSGGEAKRVSLARAFVLDPEILFLDEPFNALDSPTRQALLEDFEGVVRETKVTTVMVTHDRNEALAIGDRVAVIMGGHLRQLGTPDEVFSSPVDEEVAEFVEAGNILHGVVSEQSNGLASVTVQNGQIQAVSSLPQGTRVAVYLHHEHVTLFLNAPGTTLSSARNQLRATITRAFPLGTQLKVTLDCGFTLASLVTKRSWDELGLKVGTEVWVSFKASAVHLIPMP